MDMRLYRVYGTATYLDRQGAICRIHINRTVEAPDAGTAEVLMLAQVDIHVGATADYDPEARWDGFPTVEDETAKQEAIKACGFVVGDRVLHKSGDSAKKGADARAGIVRRIFVVEKGASYTAKLAVDWPAPNRINGDGWHRSYVLASAVIPATEEEIERRRGLNRARNERLPDRVAREQMRRG